MTFAFSADDQRRARELEWLDANDRTSDGIRKDHFRTVEFVSYDPVTGEIHSAGYNSVADLRHEAQQFGTIFLAKRGRLGLDYVDVPTLEVMPRLPCPASIDGLTIKKLPVPCLVTVTDEAGLSSEHRCEGVIGAELEFEDPGTYSVLIQSVKYLDGTYRVVVP